MKRRILILLLAMAWLLSLGALAEEPAAGENPSASVADTGEGIQLTGFDDYYGISFFEMFFLKPDDDPSALPLPESMALETNAPGNPLYDCPVEWQFSALDFDTPGRKHVPGILIPGEGYELSDTFQAKVEESFVYPLFVTGSGLKPEQLFAIAYDHPYAEDVLVPVGSPLPDLGLDEKMASCMTMEQEEFECPVEWDFSGVNTQKAGFYPVEGRYVVPDFFIAPEPSDFEPPLRFVIAVVEPDRIDLSSAHPLLIVKRLLSTWIYKPKDCASVELEYAIGDGPWTPDERSYIGSGLTHWRYGEYRYGERDGQVLYINWEELTPHVDYYFRIVYDGGKTSTTLYVRSDGEFVIADGATGDRDGGDNAGGTLPPIEQPAPDDGDDGNSSGDGNSGGNGGQPITPTPPPVTEIVTETSTTLSQARLAQLAGMGPTVLFSKQGVSAELSSDYLLGLKLGDTDTLTVTLEAVGDDGFSLFLTAGERVIETLPETVVRLPLAQTEEALTCVDSAGQTVSPAVYEPISGAARCTIFHTGSYRIQSAAPPKTPETPQEIPATPVADQSPATLPPQGDKPRVEHITSSPRGDAAQPSPESPSLTAPPATEPAPAPTEPTEPIAPAGQPKTTFPLLPVAMGGGVLGAAVLWALRRRRHD